MEPIEPTPITISTVLEILRRRKWSLVLPGALIFFAAAAAAVLLPSVFRSEATIMIEQQEIPADFVKTTVTSFAEQRIEGINHRLMSYSRLLEIITAHDLYADMRDRYTTEQIVQKMRSDTNLKLVNAEVVDRRSNRQSRTLIAFTLSYEGKNPRKVQEIANVLTSLFLQENLKERVEQVEEITKFLEAELNKLRDELSRIESNITAFKEAHVNELPELMQVNAQSLNSIENSIEMAKQRLQDLAKRREYLQVELSGTAERILAEADTVDSHQKQLENLKLQLAVITKQFSDEYPDVRRLRTQIGELERKIEEEKTAEENPKNPVSAHPSYIALTAQMAGVEQEIKSVQTQIADLNRRAEMFRKRIAESIRLEEEYRELMVARDSTRAKYNDLMSKLMEARVAHGMEKEQKAERFALIEAPRVAQKPHKPNRMAILLIGLVLGAGAGVGVAALREFSDDRLYRFEALAAATGFPVLAGIPEIVSTADRRRRWFKRLAVAGGVAGLAAAGMFGFHYFVMPLDLFWTRVLDKLARHVPLDRLGLFG